MGKGKGSFDHWAARMAPSQVVFELKGTMHEKVARDAFRVVGYKLPGEHAGHNAETQARTCSRLTRPGQWDFIKKGDPPVVGITALKGITLEDLKRPRRKIEPRKLLEAAASTVVTEGDMEASVPVTPK